MTHKQDKQLHYSVGVIVVLIGVLYLLSVFLSGSKKPVDDKMVALTPVVEENTVGDAAPGQMYLGMKTWQWVKTKSADGKEILPSGEKPFTLAFDFNSGKFALGTDCNAGSGIFAAKSGVVQFGNIASTKMFCEGSQEGIFQEYITSAQKFYFTEKGNMILETKAGEMVVFK